MSIASALTNALSGLTATGKLAEVASGNLANAMTEGYGRRSVTLAAAAPAGAGAGVAVTGVHRAADPELTAARRVADGNLAGGQTRLEALVRLERALGEAGGTDTLAARVRAFEGALRQLAETPEQAAQQAAAATAARDVAVKLNQISTESARVRQTADTEIARQVEEVNTALARIATLNRQIRIFQTSGRDAAALVDERERLIDRVAGIVPIREQAQPGGVVALSTAQGLPLADTRAQRLAFTPTPVITPAMRYDGGAGALSGLTLDGVDITPGGPGAQALTGGALAARFEVRDSIAPAVSDRADALAADLIGRLGAPGLDPTVAPGAPGLFTDAGAAHDPANRAGLAGRIRLNAAVDPAEGGAAWRLRDGVGAAAPGPASDPALPRAFLDALAARGGATPVPGVSAALSFAGTAEGVMERTALDRVTAEGEAAALGSVRETLATAEAEAIGVDSDAELQAMIRIEQAYAANAQVIQAAARMLDDLMEI